MTPIEFEERIIEWGRRQLDIKALIQIGSRVQGDGSFDCWSDWDFHLITTQPSKYHRPGWVSEIAPPWCTHVERSLRGVIKTSAVFEGSLEADFIPLVNWQLRLVYWGMQHPQWAYLMPARLRHGILETRVILLNSGYRVLIGGEEWENRLAALKTPWPILRMNQEDFAMHTSAFWQKSVWILKKIARPESRSAMHWMHKLVLQHVYALLEEEAWIAGRKARPEALKAEKWLDEKRLAQTVMATSLDQQSLARALLAQVALFEEVSVSVATSRGFPLLNHSAVAAWLRAELVKIDKAT